MEEIKYKFANGSPAVQESAVSKLEGIVVKKSSPSSPAQEELQLLWAEIKSPDPVLANLSSGSIAQLVTLGILPSGPTLLTLLSLAPQVVCPEGLISAIGRILELDQSGNRKRKPYGIASNPHPFVLLLGSFPDCWPHIQAHIRDRITTAGPVIRALNAFKPVFMFAFCDPNHHHHFGAFRSALKEILFSLLDDGKEREHVESLLWSIVTWNNYDSTTSLCENAEIAQEVLEKTGRGSSEIKILLTASFVAQSAKLGMNPNEHLRTLQRILAALPGQLSKEVANLTTLILAQAASHCPSRYHPDLLSPVLLLGSKGLLTPLVLARFALSILQFMPHMQKIEATFYKNVKTLFRLPGSRFDESFEPGVTLKDFSLIGTSPSRPRISRCS